MSKRKFDEISDPGKGGGASRPSKEAQKQQRRLGKALDNGKVELTNALKTARIFERQKLGRRHKDAKKKSELTDVARLDAEVAALKV